MLRTDHQENQALTTSYSNNLILFPEKQLFDKWSIIRYTFLFFRSMCTAYRNRSTEHNIIFIVNDVPLEMCTGGPAYLTAPNKYNGLVQEKPPDPNCNKGIFLRIF